MSKEPRETSKGILQTNEETIKPVMRSLEKKKEILSNRNGIRESHQGILEINREIVEIREVFAFFFFHNSRENVFCCFFVFFSQRKSQDIHDISKGPLETK